MHGSRVGNRVRSGLPLTKIPGAAHNGGNFGDMSHAYIFYFSLMLNEFHIVNQLDIGSYKSVYSFHIIIKPCNHFKSLVFNNSLRLESNKHSTILLAYIFWVSCHLFDFFCLVYCYLYATLILFQPDYYMHYFSYYNGFTHRLEKSRRHCVVVLEKDTFILAQYWFNPGRPVPL